MARIWKKSLSYALILALIVTLIPWSAVPKAEAAGCDTNSAFFIFNEFSTCDNEPTIVSSKNVNLTGAFMNVQSTSIGYKIERYVNGAVVGSASMGTITPIISNNSFLFTNVELFEGLNKITVFGRSDLAVGGSTVERSSYVFYGNVPVVTSVSMTNGTLLLEDTPLIVNTSNPSFLVRTNSATGVSINGQPGINGGTGTFLVSGVSVNRGLNKLEIVASNSTNSYSVERQVIYYNDVITAYDVKVGAAPNEVSLDSRPTVGALNGVVTGKLMVPKPIIPLGPGVDPVTLTVGGTTLPATVTATVEYANYYEYTFQTNDPLVLPTNGDYELRITTGYLPSTPSTPYFSVFFTVRDGNSPYITALKQLYGVVPGGGPGSSVIYSSETTFSNAQTISQLPIWVMINAENYQAGDTSSLTAIVNGSPAPADSFQTELYTSPDGLPVYKITNIPAGQVRLEFTVTRGTNHHTISRLITSVPTPAIQLDNVYNGQQIDVAEEFATIEGKMVNFNLTTDVSSVRFSLNGITKGFDTAAGIDPDTIDDDGKFTFYVGRTPNPMRLVPGANDLVITARANGVNITTRITIYLFSKDQPKITDLFPVPDVLVRPQDDVDNVRYTSDPPPSKFQRGADLTYTTTEEAAEVLFNVENTQSIVINVDGNPYVTATIDGTTVTPSDIEKIFYESTTNNKHLFRLQQVDLPIGSTNITISVIAGGLTISETLTIIREQPSHVLLSPKLPNEAVVNRNFMVVSIRANGADSVILGKEQMIKGNTERDKDIFRLPVTLKSGKNTIKYTVNRGTQKINDEFTVTYAAANTIGAEFKASVPTSGKINVFNNEINITFPKNTFLRPANLRPGQDVATVDLFNSQELLFGIADRYDGRTVKYYNAVGQLDNDGAPMDGTLVDIVEDSGAFYIRPKPHFSYASNLYWIDAGYAKKSMPDANTEYEFVQGMHPYANTNNSDTDFFYYRTLDKWLEPSQRGTITLKYDADIRNVAAANLGIWRFHNGEWQPIGGVVNTSKKTITAPFDGFGYYAVKGIAYSYSDIIGHRYARLSLETMMARGIMIPKSSYNEFGVYDNITRGEFAQVMVKMLGIELDYDPNNMTFEDVLPIDFQDQLWNYRYIETAVRKGIIRGVGPRVFMPNETLTREQAAVMIARATNMLKGNENLEKDLAALQKAFTDATLVDSYAVSSILAINKAGYIQGLPNTAASVGTFRFEPHSNLSRADAAVIVERVMKKLKRL